MGCRCSLIGRVRSYRVASEWVQAVSLRPSSSIFRNELDIHHMLSLDTAEEKAPCSKGFLNRAGKALPIG